MAKVRCKETSVDYFFGNFLYGQKVSRNHFLRKLNEVIDWSRFNGQLLHYYQGNGEVNDPVTVDDYYWATDAITTGQP